MKQLDRAVIYCRASSDPTGHHRSVAEQEAECRKVCASRGWRVAEVLVDNDVSASRYSTKARPAYQKLKLTLQPGDILVAWESSRLQRDLAAYAELADLCSALGVLWCIGGQLYDLSNADHRLATGMKAVIDRHESDQRSERMLRAKRANTARGIPNTRLPYGYRRIIDPSSRRSNGWEPDPDLAPIVVEVVRRVAARESLHAVARDLEARGIRSPSTKGYGWRDYHVRLLAANQQYAGLYVHKKSVVGRGAWEPLVSEGELHLAREVLSDPTRRTQRGSAPTRLLSGLARCHVCKQPLRRMVINQQRYEMYVCKSRERCVGWKADNLDQLVEALLLDEVSTWTLRDVAGGSESDAHLKEANRLRQQIKDATEEFYAGRLSATLLGEVERRLGPQAEALELRARSLGVSPVLVQLAGTSAPKIWHQVLGLSERRHVVSLLLDIEVKPASGWRHQPEDLVVEWHEKATRNR